MDNRRYPNLGGRLAILNACGWALLALFQFNGGRQYPEVYVVAASILGFPIVWPFLAPGAMIQSDFLAQFDIVAKCLLIGLNSFVWGYGISTMVRWIRRSTNRPCTSLPNL